MWHNKGSHATWKNWKSWKMKNLIFSPGKVLEERNNESVLEKSWKFLKIHTKLELSIFLEDLIPEGIFTANYCPRKSQF